MIINQKQFDNLVFQFNGNKELIVHLLILHKFVIINDNIILMESGKKLVELVKKNVDSFNFS